MDEPLRETGQRIIVDEAEIADADREELNYSKIFTVNHLPKAKMRIIVNAMVELNKFGKKPWCHR